MRILCPLRIPYHEHGLLWGLRQERCEVRILEGSPVSRQALANAVEEFRPDLIFSYGWWHGRLRIEDLAWIRERYRLPLIYWASDDPTHHSTTSLPMAQISDFLPTTTEELCSVYRAMGKKTAYLQFACNPRIHRRIPAVNPHRYDAVLIATNYSRYDPIGVTYRTRCARMMLDGLIEADFQIRVFGDGWDDSGSLIHIFSEIAAGAIPYEKQAEIYATASIVLGMQTECHWSTQTSCRPFEVLGCGAFLLAPWTRATGNLFIPGKHLQVSRSVEETIALVRYYLDHDVERERIAAAGQLEVYRKHTYLHRARELLAAVAQDL